MNSVKYFIFKKNLFSKKIQLQLVLAFALLMSCTFTKAQILEGDNAREIHPSIEKVRVTPEQQTLKNIYFDKTQQPELVNLPSVLDEALSSTNQRTTSGLTFKAIEDKVNEQGLQQVKYQQYYNGIPLEAAFSRAQVNEGKVEYVMGRFYQNADVKTIPKIESTDAFKTIQKTFEGAMLMSEHYTHNNHHKHFDGVLVILKKENQDYLCWKFDVYTELGFKRVFIDAQTGKLVKNYPLQSNCNAASGNTTMYGTESGVNTEKVGSYHFLKNSSCSNEVDVHVRDWNSNTNIPGNLLEYRDYGSNNYWNDNTKDRSAFQTYWLVNKVLDYFDVEFNRDSYNDNGAPITVYQEVMFPFRDSSGNIIGYYGNNAAMGSNGEMYIGRGGNANSGSDDINTMDIIAHEFAHAVTRSTADLIYEKESGALNESFSDIFGAAFEFWADNANADWLMGEDLQNFSAFRSMSNPNSYNDPDTYQGSYWADTNNSYDNGGVHTNSGVQNFWFYLLVEGGTGTNDIGQSYNVTGIGLAKAMDIVYKTLTEELVDPNADYFDARTASIQAAADLFTNCSNEFEQVMNAWHAVGVGTASNCNSNPQPDLIVINTNVTPNPVTPGSSITATCNVKNIGDAATGEGTYLFYYLSEDNSYSSDDTYIGYDFILNLGADAQSSQQSVTYTVPTNATGCKSIIYIIDGFFNLIAESNETNNYNSSEICFTNAASCDPPIDSALSATALCNGAYVYCNKSQYHNVRKRLQYKKTTDNTWTTAPTSTRHYIKLTGLDNVQYQYKFALECTPNSGNYSNYSTIKTFTPNSCRMGGASLESSTFNVYPNPTKDLININLDANETAGTVRIFDLQGRLAKEWDTQYIEGASFQLDLSELNTGVYILRINDTRFERITKL